MFSNSRKTIGVILERSIEEFQKNLCEGILEEAGKRGYNVAVFSLYGKYGHNEEHFAGDQTLLELPDYGSFDGIILALDTIVQEENRQIIRDNIRKQCRCPVVSIRERVEGAYNLLVDNRTCMEKMVEHFVKFHGFSRLCFMTGPKDHWDAVERMEGFVSKMKEFGLSVGEHQLFYGDYWYNMGKEACDWFLNDAEPLPEAILCANDYMALAVASELINRGLRIPEDICVSGYDGMKDTLFFTPTVSTLSVPFKEMGEKAVALLDENQGRKIKTEDYFFQTQLSKRESCGCLKRAGTEITGIKRAQYEESRISHNRDVQFDYLLIHLSYCDTIGQIAEVMCQFSENLEGIRHYAVCLCDGLEGGKEFYHYTDTMNLRIGMKTQENMGDICIPFDKKQLLPSEITSDEPQFWYFAPLHFQNQCYGYEAFHFWTPDQSGNLFFQWNVTLGNKIHDLLMAGEMKRLIYQLEDMYDKDPLTGLYNRRGLDRYWRSLFEQAKRRKTPLFLSVIDLDGMKSINDNHGHIEGDFAICKICEIMKASCDGTCICARTGGDEFVVAAEGITAEKGNEWMQRIEEALADFNASAVKEYPIYASIGAVCRMPGEEDSLESYTREGDEIMYRNKLENKRRRGEQIRRCIKPYNQN